MIPVSSRQAIHANLSTALPARSEKFSGGFRIHFTPVVTLLGGLMLLGSAILPGKKLESDLFHKSIRSLTDTGIASDSQQNPITAHTLNEVMFLLGWTLTSIGRFTGGWNKFRTGAGQKQPSISLGGLGAMMSAPWMIVDPSIVSRTAFQLSIGLLLSGFANKVRNEFQLAPGDTPREFDMAALTQRARLIEKARKDGNSELATWLSEAGNMVRFVAKDQLLVVQKGSAAVAKTIAHPLKTLAGIKNGATEVYQFIARQRRESPGFLKPTEGQNHVASLLVYAGGIPLLFLGGEEEAVKNICTGLIAAGTVPSSQSLFAIGLNKPGVTERSLLVGVPLAIMGNAVSEPTTGMGLYAMGRATFDQYYAQEATRQTFTGESYQQQSSKS